MKRVFAVFILSLLAVFAALPAMAADGDDNCCHMLINKEHALPDDYTPSSLVYLNRYIKAGSSVMMTRQAAEAMETMINAMADDGITDIYGQSGYRSYSTQYTVYQNKIAYYLDQGYGYEYAQAAAATVVAPPGTSEHQTGLALDFGTSTSGLNESFGDTAAGRWLAVNSWRYGFILRYPKGKESITGYIFEPWHFRYVGRVHAEYMYRNNLTLDQYLALLEKETVLTFVSEDGQSYAVYFTTYNNTRDLAGTLISASRAYADREQACLTVTALPDAELFNAVSRWAENYVRQRYSIQVVSGYADNSFRKTKDIDRAELLSLVAEVYQLLYPQGLDAESREYIENTLVCEEELSGDMLIGSYYLQPLMELEESGLLVGDGLRPCFLPEQPSLKGEAALSVSALFSEEELQLGGSVLNDMTNADGGLQAAVQTLVDSGILVSNAGSSLTPEMPVSHPEISTMLCRVLTYLRYFR